MSLQKILVTSVGDTGKSAWMQALKATPIYSNKGEEIYEHQGYQLILTNYLGNDKDLSEYDYVILFIDPTRLDTLKEYMPWTHHNPPIIVVNKADTLTCEEIDNMYKEIKGEFSFPTFFMSAKEGCCLRFPFEYLRCM